MLGLVCIEIEFKSIQFQCNWEIFFYTKRMGEKRGELGKKKVIFKL